MKRMTETTKWRDPWFRRLSPTGKILFLYLCDNCDNAGFWEIDLDLAAFETGIQTRGIEGAFEELSSRYETDKRFIWLRNFLRHQKNLPLNPNNPAHKNIINILESRKSFSGSILKILKGEEILEETEGATKGLNGPKGNSNGMGRGIGKGKGKKRFVKPTQEQIRAYGKKIGYNINPEAFIAFYKSKGWKVGDQPMQNWEAAIVTWKTRDEKKRKSNDGEAHSEYPETNAPKAKVF